MKLKISNAQFIHIALCIVNSISRSVDSVQHYKKNAQFAFFNYTRMNFNYTHMNLERKKPSVNFFHSFSIIKLP